MNQNNGMGAVDPLQKNVFLTDFLTEKITVVRSEYIRGYWVIVHKRESNQFLAYKVDGCGVDPIPVTSNVGTELLGANSNFDPRMPFYGSMKANNAGDRIAMPIDDSKFSDFYSFDAASGQLLNPITIEVTDNTPASPIRKYGCSFSPDGSMFYYTNNISVYQLKLTAYDSLSIATSHTLIATPANPTFQIEEGLDGKLYVAIAGSNVLDVINAPNSSFCDYMSNALSTNGRVLLGLPARVPKRSFSSPPITMLPDSCWQSTSSFSINSGVSINQVSWNFGDPNSGGSNTSSSLNPSHQFSETGTYQITATVDFECYTETVTQNISLFDCSDTIIGTITVFENYTLFVPNSFSPDGNEYNNLFEVSGYGIDPHTFLLQIYNRWGELIFVSKDPEKGWDGSYGNTLEMAPIGTYTYNLNYKIKTQDQPKSISGHVNLIR